jgi:spore germination protein KB
MKKLVSVRQLIMILIVSMFGIKVLVLPNLFSKSLGRDSYIFVFFLLLLDFLVLLSFLFVKNKFKGKNFYEILELLFGKVVAKIILFLFLLFFVLKSSAIFETNYVYLTENLYTNFNWFVFSLPFLTILILVSFQGVNALARTFEIFFPVIIVGLIFSITIGAVQADFSNLLPFMENGLSNFQQIFRFTFWFGDYIIFIIFFDNVREEKKMNLKIILYVLGGMLLIVALFAVFYAKYNYSSICHSNAISDLIQMSPSMSDVGSFDWLLILVWDIVLFLVFTINLLGAFYCFRHTFFKPPHIIIALILVGIVFALNFFTNFDIYFSIDFAQDYLLYFSIGIQYGLPVLIFVFALFKGGKKNEVSVAK